jgi:uncharacterized membrane protein YdbT with pleckstrin-like domain
MTYIQNTLLNDEKVQWQSGPHWIVFMPAGFMCLLAGFVWLYAPILLAGGLVLFSINLQSVVTLIVFLMALVSIAKAMIIYRTTEYGVTNKRIIMKTGWVQRQTLETFLMKVEAVNIDQSVLGRVLGYGTIIVVGTGGSRDPFYNVPQPLVFRKVIQQQMSL